MTKKAGITLTALIAISALLVPAQAPSSELFRFSGARHYEGEVDQPAKIQGQATTEFWVKFKSGKPVRVFPFFSYDVAYTCSDGKTYYPGSGGGATSKKGFPRDVRVKRRKFSATSNDEGMAITGRIPRHGPASGTLRLFAHEDFCDLEGQNCQHMDCDSGSLRWTAPVS